jgi:hypothetical protein
VRSSFLGEGTYENYVRDGYGRQLCVGVASGTGITGVASRLGAFAGAGLLRTAVTEEMYAGLTGSLLLTVPSVFAIGGGFAKWLGGIWAQRTAPGTGGVPAAVGGGGRCGSSETRSVNPNRAATDTYTVGDKKQGGPQDTYETFSHAPRFPDEKGSWYFTDANDPNQNLCKAEVKAPPKAGGPNPGLVIKCTRDKCVSVCTVWYEDSPIPLPPNQRFWPFTWHNTGVSEVPVRAIPRRADGSGARFACFCFVPNVA